MGKKIGPNSPDFKKKEKKKKKKKVQFARF
jgi:hypothetical protein